VQKNTVNINKGIGKNQELFRSENMIKSEIIKGQKSWVLENKNIRLCLTEKGGHMAPVVFMKDTDRPIEPFYINPWAEEGLSEIESPGCLGPLRGDFFCLPFGADNSWNGEQHPAHGEVSRDIWTLLDDKSDNYISMKMNTKVRRGSVEKKIALKEGENNLYINHTIKGFSGPATPGHHAIFPGGSMKYISMSAIKFGYTDNNRNGGYSNQEYYSLAPFQKFESLEKVPTIWKGKEYTDCSVFPAREGFVDVLQVYSEAQENFAWTAVAVPKEGYLWFALKDPEILPATVMWMANKGRHQSPWNGRNVCIGVEDVCSSLADGLAVSAENNALAIEGIKTCHELQKNGEMNVKYIQGVVLIPDGFDRVKAIVKKGDGVEISSFSGKVVFTKVDSEFIRS
jgi:hypothetical protein